MPKVTLVPPSFRAAIFDFDGTLALTDGLWRMVDEAFFARRGIPYDAEIARALSTRGFAEGAEWCIERYNLDEAPEAICAEWTETSIELYKSEVCLRPGAEDYLLYLRSLGIPLALATINDRKILASMQRVDIFSLFDCVVCGQEGGRSKAHPDIFYKAACELGVGPADTIVFEDTPDAIATAAAAGFSTCALEVPGSAHQDFESLRNVADAALTSWDVVYS